MESTQANLTTPNRVQYALAAFAMQIFLGILYSWSIFRGPLAQLHGWSKAQTIAPYRYSMLTFAISMIMAGFWQDRKGPRVVASFGGILLGTGCILVSLIGGTVGGVVLAYGVIAGLGLGFAYVTSIATCIRWFPDKRGMIVGFCVMGFGMGPLVFGPLAQSLMGVDPARLATTIPRTFAILGVILFVGVVGLAQIFKVPPPGWQPKNWTPAPGHTSGVEIKTSGMVSTWQFYALWILFFLIAAVGLTAIGQAAPMLQELSRTAVVISTGLALGIIGFINGVGRMVWGVVFDHFGRRAAAIGMSVACAVACLGFLRSADGFWLVLLGLALVSFAYGASGVLLPSFVADYYGPKNVGANYGLIFTAWGLAGFVVPGYFESMLDRARIAGDLTSGYREVYLELGILAIVASVISAVLYPPRMSREKSVVSVAATD